MRVISLMSGTSLDGLDICYCSIDSKNGHWSYQLHQAVTLPYSKEWTERLTFNPNLTDEQVSALDHQYGNLLAECVSDFIATYAIPKEQVDLIASHGHTLYHRPEEKYTLQIGNGPELFDIFNIPVACDFRKQDVELSGQGAPLVPVGDQLLFHQYDACLNLGGFSNISFEKDGQRIAYDISPVNFVLNLLSQKLGFDFDRDGVLAKSGTIDNPLLAKLNRLDYYQQAPPKSLGAEWVNKNVGPLLQESSLGTIDLLATFTQHIAEQLAHTINSNGLKTVLVTGGGTLNRFLIQRLEELTQANLNTTENELIDFKEVLVFALLGVLKYSGQNNVLASVTGAIHDHCSGTIYS